MSATASGPEATSAEGTGTMMKEPQVSAQTAQPSATEPGVVEQEQPVQEAPEAPAEGTEAPAENGEGTEAPVQEASVPPAAAPATAAPPAQPKGPQPIPTTPLGGKKLSLLMRGIPFAVLITRVEHVNNIGDRRLAILAKPREAWKVGRVLTLVHSNSGHAAFGRWRIDAVVSDGNVLEQLPTEPDERFPFIAAGGVDLRFVKNGRKTAIPQLDLNGQWGVFQPTIAGGFTANVAELFDAAGKQRAAQAAAAAATRAATAQATAGLTKAGAAKAEALTAAGALLEKGIKAFRAGTEGVEGAPEFPTHGTIEEQAAFLIGLELDEGLKQDEWDAVYAKVVEAREAIATEEAEASKVTADKEQAEHDNLLAQLRASLRQLHKGKTDEEIDAMIAEIDATVEAPGSTETEEVPAEGEEAETAGDGEEAPAEGEGDEAEVAEAAAEVTEAPATDAKPEVRLADLEPRDIPQPEAEAVAETEVPEVTEVPVETGEQPATPEAEEAAENGETEDTGEEGAQPEAQVQAPEQPTPATAQPRQSQAKTNGGSGPRHARGGNGRSGSRR